MLKNFKRYFSLTNILKFVGILIIILFLSGFLAGFINIQQAKKEKKDIAEINSIIQAKGLSNEAKTAIASFMKDYPRTKNIILCDEKGNIVYKANEQYVQGESIFDILKDEQQPGMYRMKKGPGRFMPIPKREIFSLIPPSDSQAERGFENSPNRRNSIEPFDDMHRGAKRNPDFISSFDISGKSMKIYFISGRFEENKMIDMFFVSHQVLRLLILIFWVLLAVWVYDDSKKRGLQQIVWGLITLFTGLIGFIIYLIVRKRLSFCSNCKAEVTKEANYCYQCGNALKIKCDSCESMMNFEWNYCVNCGKKRE
ncbi:MAG: zinc ribbon domain-containing protein [Deltaproteobacteria bacterium]